MNREMADFCEVFLQRFLCCPHSPSQPKSSTSLKFDFKVGGFVSHRQYHIKELNWDFEGGSLVLWEQNTV